MYGTGKLSLFIFILEGVITVSHVLVRYPCGGWYLLVIDHFFIWCRICYLIISFYPFFEYLLANCLLKKYIYNIEKLILKASDWVFMASLTDDNTQKKCYVE